jgi:hypothetical protein
MRPPLVAGVAGRSTSRASRTMAMDGLISARNPANETRGAMGWPLEAQVPMSLSELLPRAHSQPQVNRDADRVVPVERLQGIVDYVSGYVRADSDLAALGQQ